MSNQNEQPKRTNINLSGIVRYCKSRQTVNNKTVVELILQENIGNKENPEYISYKCTAVGDAATYLDGLLRSGGIPIGRENPNFAILYSENCRPASQNVKAQRREYISGAENLVGNQFNADLLTFTIFNAELRIITTNQQAPQQPMQQGGYQQPTQPMQQAPQKPMQQAPQQPAQQPPQQPVQPSTNFDDFDDDIPF